MRIIAGKHRGRKLHLPSGHNIRPTSDKIRGAIFNKLRHMIDLEGTAVLDACCGSGALGLEALSNGAAFCTFIDRDQKSLALAKKNAGYLGETATDFMMADITKLKPRAISNKKASLVFLDPPYFNDIANVAVKALQDGNFLASECILVIETEKPATVKTPENFILDSEKTYGDTKITVLRFTE